MTAGRLTRSGSTEAATYTTRFGSLADYEKGGVELINDDARHYAFSNVFDVASKSKPWEKVAVGKNFEYVLEAVRAEGTSPWRTAAHDEFVLCMDGEVVVDLVKLDATPLPADAQGSIALDGEPQGRRMGRITLRRGHQGLLPAGSAYRFTATVTGVLIIQTILGPDTKLRWAEICQTV